MPNQRNGSSTASAVRWVSVGLVALVLVGGVVSLFWNTAAKAEAKAVEAKHLAVQNTLSLGRHTKRLETLEESRMKMVKSLGVIEGNLKVLLERTKER